MRNRVFGKNGYISKVIRVPNDGVDRRVYEAWSLLGFLAATVATYGLLMWAGLPWLIGSKLSFMLAATAGLVHLYFLRTWDIPRYPPRLGAIPRTAFAVVALLVAVTVRNHSACYDHHAPYLASFGLSVDFYVWIKSCCAFSDLSWRDVLLAASVQNVIYWVPEVGWILLYTCFVASMLWRMHAND